VLTDEHFEAIEKIWTATGSVEPDNRQKDDAVLILPQNYGWGMRREDDRIWGVWDQTINQSKYGISAANCSQNTISDLT
jgi:hypothetical protein